MTLLSELSTPETLPNGKVTWQSAGGVCLLTLTNPPANGYSYEMMRDIDEAVLRARFDDSVHAIVVAKPGTDLHDEDVIAYAREHLAHYKVPRSLSWLDELPKTGSGKVLKRELRQPYWEGHGSNV